MVRMSNIFDIKSLGSPVMKGTSIPCAVNYFSVCLAPYSFSYPEPLRISHPRRLHRSRFRCAAPYSSTSACRPHRPRLSSVPKASAAGQAETRDPHFVFPQPAHDEQDAVFTVAHGPYNMTWVNTAFNLAEGHMQYVAFIPSTLAMTVDVHLTPALNGTHVNVTFVHTALDPSVNAKVTEMAEHHRNAGPGWAHDMESCLKQHRDPL